MNVKVSLLALLVTLLLRTRSAFGDERRVFIDMHTPENRITSNLTLSSVDGNKFRAVVTIRNFTRNTIRVSTYNSWTAVIMDSVGNCCEPAGGGSDATTPVKLTEVPYLKPGKKNEFSFPVEAKWDGKNYSVAVFQRTAEYYYRLPPGEYKMAIISFDPQLAEYVSSPYYERLKIKGPITRFPWSNWATFTLK